MHTTRTIVLIKLLDSKRGCRSRFALPFALLCKINFSLLNAAGYNCRALTMLSEAELENWLQEGGHSHRILVALTHSHVRVSLVADSTTFVSAHCPLRAGKKGGVSWREAREPRGADLTPFTEARCAEPSLLQRHEAEARGAGPRLLQPPPTQSTSIT